MALTLGIYSGIFHSSVISTRRQAYLRAVKILTVAKKYCLICELLWIFFLMFQTLIMVNPGICSQDRVVDNRWLARLVQQIWTLRKEPGALEQNLFVTQGVGTISGATNSS